MIRLLSPPAPGTFDLLLLVACLAVSAAGYVALGYFIPRNAFGPLVLTFAVLFAAFWYLVQWYNDQVQWYGYRLEWLLGAALLFRLLLLFAVPALSDDFYRFLWDGQLSLAGINPFRYTPRQLFQSGWGEHDPLTALLFGEMNSPDYYTVYPPVLQSVFGLAATFASFSPLGGVVVLRLCILAAEMLSVRLLTQLLAAYGLPPGRVLLYALNPLVIVELTGNVHFEALMIVFLLAFLAALHRNGLRRAALFLALSAGVKLLPLLFLPLVLATKGWKTTLRLGAWTAFFFGLCWLPFLAPGLFNIFASLNLYFQTFEFNASVYYVLREAGHRIHGYNVISILGPALGLTTLLTVLGLAWLGKKRGIPLVRLMLPALTVYFGLATIVHPWYVTSLVALGVFMPWKYPIVWSGMVVLSYAAYGQVPYHEDLRWVFAEYGVVLLAIVYDVYKHWLTPAPRSPTATALR
ncbi:MAG: FIG00930204: hypothetical protein [uncultured Cytophagales bacterium]|uniref:DUF2029 domain-containing protein n=1 Tax=uncultured Cytophagales bacterium TaxID=158755 RepID=A0A6J4KIT7_9SPHI|nr:MAG: FIG00930204: hypothetical protein [uncultured Cytophagales bacterium]